MANRHIAQCKAKGGKVSYTGGASKASAASGENKFSGKVVGFAGGSKAKSRIKKACGGGVGAYSSAHRG